DDPGPAPLGAVPPAQDGRRGARAKEEAGDVDDEGRFSRSPGGDVSDADDRDRQTMNARPLPIVEGVAGIGDQLPDGGRRPESGAPELCPRRSQAVTSTAFARNGRSSTTARSSAPEPSSTTRRARSPARARIVGSSASLLKREASPGASAIWNAPPASRRRAATSRAFAMWGPKMGATPWAAGSTRLWPPIGASDPPTNATVAEA